VYNIFSVSIGDTVSIGGGREDFQGGMPVTVGDMWDLTAEQRLALVVSKETLEYNARDTLYCRERIKALKQLIDTPQPAAPKPYSGPSVFELDEEMQTLSAKIASRTGEIEAQAKRGREINRLRFLLDTANESVLEWQEFCSKASVADDSVPGWIERYDTVQEFLDSVASAIHWVGSNTAVAIGRAAIAVEECRKHMELPVTIPVMATENSSDRLEEAIQKVANINQQIAALEAIPAVGDEDIAKDVARLDELREAAGAAYEWKTFEKRTKEWAEQRGKAVAELEEMKAKLEELTQERAAIVNKLKGSIEGAANDMLSRVGLSPLEIEIVTTAQKAALKVSVAGVAIEALAASEKLLYGICLLLAIQQASDAKCPILVAECAETDEAMFNRLIGAIGEPEKGNTVLEHWMKTHGSIYMGCE